jgi:hypothetical protein
MQLKFLTEMRGRVELGFDLSCILFLYEGFAFLFNHFTIILTILIFFHSEPKDEASYSGSIAWCYPRYFWIQGQEISYNIIHFH